MKKKVTARLSHGATKKCGRRKGGFHLPTLHRLISIGVQPKDSLPNFKTINVGFHLKWH